jgi:hypothetical protein
MTALGQEGKLDINLTCIIQRRVYQNNALNTEMCSRISNYTDSNEGHDDERDSCILIVKNFWHHILVCVFTGSVVWL